MSCIVLTTCVLCASDIAQEEGDTRASSTQVGLSDLPVTGTDFQGPSVLRGDMSYEKFAQEEADDAFISAIDNIVALIEDTLHDSGSMVSKSLSATVSLHADDEGFTVSDDSGTAQAEFFADYLDLVASANTDDLVGFFLGTTDMDSDAVGDAKFGASTYLTLHTTEHADDKGLKKALASLYLAFSASSVAPDASQGTVNGTADLSFGSTLCEYDANDDDEDEEYYIPYVVQFSMKAFEDVPIGNVIEAYSRIVENEDEDEGLTESDLEYVCDRLWGGHEGNDYLTLKVLFADENGDQMTDKTYDFSQLQCLQIIASLFGSLD